MDTPLSRYVPIQHPTPHEFGLVLAGTAGRYYPEGEEDAEVPHTMRMGQKAIMGTELLI